MGIFENLKSIKIGEKNIGEMIKPFEDMANQIAYNRNESKKELSFTVQLKKTFSKNTQPLTIRKDVDNLYYISNGYNLDAERFSFDGILWNGSTFTQQTITKGDIIDSESTASVFIGDILADSMGIKIDHTRGKKNKVTTHSVTKSTEKGSVAIIYLRSKTDNTIKEIKAVFTMNDMQNASFFFSKEAPSNTTIDSNDGISQLREFKQLLDEGIISQEEFDRKKKEVLDL